MLRGTVGLSRAVTAVGLLVVGVGVVMMAMTIAIGVSLLARGRIGEGLPAVLIPAGLGVYASLVVAFGLQHMRSDRERLVEELGVLLDARN